ncbi:RAMP superfamily protein [Clostridium liquoris]|uniref:RAMP superfamily protein n=1 Tax=Clostridium liquoris TaxID=1289519 RepID=A0A2T0B220_9CLOT|nr:type III-B CRISPR module RAMP protein Cmr4 [Clostridium liquoris]PRR77939.1 RAMP superfamily protein [Clostridium liquoris]
MDNFKLYKIRCLTNMHVGNGDASYTLIDNQVQKDAITGFPVINSSSLKGSLKNFLGDKCDIDEINNIFGDNMEGIGQYKIFPGMLLSIPLRSNKKPFFRATCPRIIKDFIDFVSNFQYRLDYMGDLEKIQKLVGENKNSISVIKCFNEDIEDDKDLRVEGFRSDLKDGLDIENNQKITSLFGENLIIVDDRTFLNIVSELPIIARNKLDNGESENLWYEEIVPRETRFYFGVMCGKKHVNKFEKIKGHPIQIGGNATIGYGYCNITSINEK